MPPANVNAVSSADYHNEAPPRPEVHDWPESPTFRDSSRRREVSYERPRPGVSYGPGPAYRDRRALDDDDDVDVDVRIRHYPQREGKDIHTERIVERVIERRESPPPPPFRRRTDDWGAADETGHRRDTATDPKIEFRHGTRFVRSPEPAPRARDDSPRGPAFPPQRTRSFYGQPLVPTSRRGHPPPPPPPRMHRDDPRDAPGAPKITIESTYPSLNVRYPPPPDMSRRRGATAPRPRYYVDNDYYDDNERIYIEREEYVLPLRRPSYGPIHIRHDDELDRLRLENDLLHERLATAPAPLARGPRARGGRDMLDPVDELDVFSEREMMEEMEDRIRRKVLLDVEREKLKAELERANEEMKLDRLRREVEETTRLKIEEERRAAEEAERRAAEEKSRVEREVRQKIEAEHKAAAEAREAEARREEASVQLAQAKLQQSMDEMVALAREKILQDLGTGTGTGKPVDKGKGVERNGNRLQADVEVKVEAEGTERREGGFRRHRMRQPSEDSDRWVQPPSDAPEPPDTFPDTESDIYSAVTSSSTASTSVESSPDSSSKSSASSRGGDWKARRRRRMEERRQREEEEEEEKSRFRRDRQFLRMIREELVDPIAEAVAAGRPGAGAAYGHKPSPFYRSRHWRPYEARSPEPAYEPSDWDSEYYYTTSSESGNETITPRKRQWRQWAHRPPTSTRTTTRGRSVDRWPQQAESSSSQESPDAAALDGDGRLVEVEPAPAAILAPNEIITVYELEDSVEDAAEYAAVEVVENAADDAEEEVVEVSPDNTTEAGTVVGTEAEPAKPVANPSLPSDEESFTQVGHDEAPTEVNSEVLPEGLTKQESIIHADEEPAAPSLPDTTVQTRQADYSDDGAESQTAGHWQSYMIGCVVS